MQRQNTNALDLTAALLGAQGLRRAYPLVAFDRPRMTLTDWIAEGLRAAEWRRTSIKSGEGERPKRGSTPPREPSDRLLAFSSSGSPLPRCGVVGLATNQGCLVAVFGYQILKDSDGGRFLVIRGPSKAALIGDGLVGDHVKATIERLSDTMGCCRTILRNW
jgi:hypothetical protein